MPSRVTDAFSFCETTVTVTFLGDFCSSAVTSIAGGLSGCQSGLPSANSLNVNWASFDPSAFIVHSSSSGPVLRTKTDLAPSGEKAGEVSVAGPSVRGPGLEPSAFTARIREPPPRR